LTRRRTFLSATGPHCSLSATCSLKSHSVQIPGNDSGPRPATCAFSRICNRDRIEAMATKPLRHSRFRQSENDVATSTQIFDVVGPREPSESFSPDRSCDAAWRAAELGVEMPMMNHGVFRIAGRIQYLERRPAIQHFNGQLPPVDRTGHHHVSEQKIDLFALIDDRQSLTGVARSERPVTEALNLGNDVFRTRASSSTTRIASSPPSPGSSASG